MERSLRITIPGECEEEFATHDVGHNDVTWPIWIYRRTPIEKCYSDFWRVDDKYWLASCVEVDKITWER
jgi:hypothetical protein